VRGLSCNFSWDRMRVNMLVSTDRGLFVDTFDLYSARHRRQFIVQAAIELDLEETPSGRTRASAVKLKELHSKQIEHALEPKNVLSSQENPSTMRHPRNQRDRPELIDAAARTIGTTAIHVSPVQVLASGSACRPATAAGRPPLPLHSRIACPVPFPDIAGRSSRYHAGPGNAASVGSADRRG